MRNRPLSRGFTLVELLVVIVVIAVLAAITVVAYRGIQGRARDAERVQDVNAIVKALEVYKAQNGSYPEEQASGWEESDAYPKTFINALVTRGVVNQVPVDPKNVSPSVYAYYLYAGGSYGCDATRGNYYVLVVRRGETGTTSLDSPGFKCSGRDWSSEGWYVTGAYTS